MCVCHVTHPWLRLLSHMYVCRGRFPCTEIFVQKFSHTLHAHTHAHACTHTTRVHTHTHTPHMYTHTHTHYTCICTCTCIYHCQNWLRGPHLGGEPAGGNKTGGPVGSGDTSLVSTSDGPLSALGYSSTDLQDP